jgi:hypothetical protein
MVMALLKNYLPILALLMLSSSLMVQPDAGKKRAIIIKNLRNSEYVKISRGLPIHIRTKNGLSYSAMVKGIMADTIFLQDTLLRFGDIDTISMRSNPPRPEFIPGSSKKTLYASGSPAYQVTFPPDSVYYNLGTFHLYYSRLTHQASREKREKTYPLLYDNFIKINITKIFHLEAAFSYERKISKNATWETELSAIFGIPESNAYYTINYPLYNYSGFSITTYPKFYIINTRTYVSPVFMYRYLWAVGIRTGWPDHVDEGELQDQYRNDFGISARVGFMKRYGRFVFDCYFGAGIKYIMLHQLVYGIYEAHDSGRIFWYNEDHSPNVYDQRLFGPVINAGIKIGFAF